MPVSKISVNEYRYPGEIISLVITFSVIIIMVLLAIWFFPGIRQSVINVLLVTLVAVVVYVLVILIQQRMALGTMIRVSPRQFPEVYRLAGKASDSLSMRGVPVYVERSANLNIYPLGLWRRPIIVVTSVMLDQMDHDNLYFLIAREISHIQAGHTWLRVLLKPLGADVAIIGRLFNRVIFGDWVIRSELTADRAGFIACQSLTSSVRTMLKYGVGASMFKQLDIEEFLGQITDVSNMAGRVAEIVAGQPYLIQRIRALTEFVLSEQAQGVMSTPHSGTRILESMPDSFVRPATDGSPQPGMHWILVSQADGARYHLAGDSTSVGRHPDNDIVIQSGRVSRFHAEIVREGNGLAVMDKASSNGVWLNGTRVVGSEAFAEGDCIAFGKSEFRLERAADD